jgi:hypothetical protein
MESGSELPIAPNTKSRINLPIILLVTANIIGLSASVFLYRQNEHLRLQLERIALTPHTLTTNRPIEPWNKLTNTLYGYSIEYPGTWVAHNLDADLLDNLTTEDVLVITPNEPSDYQGGGMGPFHFINSLLIRVKDDQSYEDFKTRTQKYAATQDGRVLVTDTKINDYEVLLMEIKTDSLEGEDLPPGHYYYVNNNTNLIQLFYSGYDLTLENKEFIEKIIHTLRIKTTALTPTVMLSPTITITKTKIDFSRPWQTYTHQQFSFEYPREWEPISQNVAQPSQETNVGFGNSSMRFSVYIDPPSRGDHCTTLIKSEKIMIDTVATNYAIWRKNSECPQDVGSSEITLSFEHSNHYYLITLNINTIDEDVAEQAIKRILSTFKFSAGQD